MKTTPTAIALAGAALFGLAGATTPAAAHGHHAHYYLRAAPFVYVDPSYDYDDQRIYTTGCGYEKYMWLDTGSRYWKARYFECRGWW